MTSNSKNTLELTAEIVRLRHELQAARAAISTPADATPLEYGADVERKTILQLLRLLNECQDTHDLIRKLTGFLQQWTGCDSIGVRLREGDDFPYFETRGFPPEFVQAENHLCCRDADGKVVRDFQGNPIWECVCGNVLSGQFNPAQPFFSHQGSFWTNSTTELLASTTEADRPARMRNFFNGAGYESVALVALRYRRQTFGLLQVNDRKKGRFSPELIAFLEKIADLIATTLAQRWAEESLRTSEDQLRRIIETSPDAIVVIDLDARVQLANHQAAKLGGFDSVDELLASGKSGFELVTPEETKRTGADLLRVIQEDIVRDLEYTVVRKDGGLVPVEVSAAVLKDHAGDPIGLICVVRDIADRKTREREIERLNRLYSALSELNQTIVRVTSRNELFHEVCRIATDKAGFKIGWIGCPDPTTHEVIVVASAGSNKGYLEGIRVYVDDRPEGRGPTGTCLREEKPCVFNDCVNDSRTLPWHAAAAAYGLRAAASLPIMFDGNVWGALTVYDDAPNVFQEKEVALLEEAAAAISLALESLEREKQRQAAEKALQQSEHRYRSLFDNMRDGFAYCKMLFDDQGRPVDFVYLAVNNAFERLTGLKDVVGKQVTAVIPGIKELSPDLFEIYGRVALTGKPEEFEFDFKPMNAWLSIAVYSIEKGYFVAVFDNITERKRAEEQVANLNHNLQCKVAELETILHTAPIGIAIADDAECRTIRCNPGLAEMLGVTTLANCSKGAPLGERPENYRVMQEGRELAPEELPMQVAASRRVVVTNSESDIVRDDGRTVNISCNAAPLFDEHGHVRGAIGTFWDIGEIKKVQQQLNDARLAAEAANRAKSQFLANMSHEIRTPMTAVLGFADLLAGHDLTPREQHEFIETIRRNGRSLLELINDILDLSKIEAEKLSVESVDCSLRQLVDDVMAAFQVQVQEKGLSLRIDYAPSLPETICTDPTRLRQILLNLIGNAVKFTKRGAVRLAIENAKPRHGSVRMRFAVSDTGIGIESEKLEGLFQPFTQADSSTTRRFGGTGLGLVISKRLANLLGGDIEVVSKPSQGSTFTVTIDVGPIQNQCRLPDLPIVPTAEPALTAEEMTAGLRGRVLLAEDAADLQDLLRHILHSMNLEIEIAENGSAACEKAVQSIAKGSPFDLILMDVQMPGMDGLEATRWLRSHGWKNPIVALTAHVMAGDREKCLAAGCDDYLAKAFQLRELRAVVARHLRRTADTPPR